MWDWIDKAKQIYLPLGAEFKGKPVEINFPSGAIIKTGHLKDENAYEKYQGHGYHRMLLEELTQIPTEESYLKLISSCRSTIPELKPRIFASANPGGRGHCVPFGEVITKNGFKDIRDIEIGEMVLTLGEDNKQKFVRVDQKIEEDYSGKLFYSKKFVCTPDHKIAIQTETKNRKGRKYNSIKLRRVKDFKEVTRFPKIGDFRGKEIKSFRVKNTESRVPRLKQPFEIEGDLYCKLMGWFLSEGHTGERDKCFGISQVKKENRNKIRELLLECKFKFKENKSGFIIYSKSWFDELKKYGKCRDKFIPKEIKNATREQMGMFLETAILGDGNGIRYYTTSKRLADDIQEVAHKLGKKTYLSQRQRKNRKGLSYTVSIKENRREWIEKDKIKQIDYKGKVYCLGINRLHRFYLRQNGTVYLSGNSWVKDRFITPAPPLTVFKDKVTGRSRVYIPATIDDNPTLMKNDPQYVAFLEGLPEKLKKAWRYGDWDIFEGQFFNEWDRTQHVVKPFNIPDSWAKFRSIDPSGRHGTTSCHWYAVDWDGVVWCYREHYGSGKDADEHAKEIALLSEGEDYKYTVIDSAAFSKLGLPESIAEVYERNGVEGLVPSSKKRIDGWNAVHRYLRWKKYQLPKLRIFNTCVKMIETIPAMIHDEKTPDDLDTDLEDHAVDELRYFLQTIRDQKVSKPKNKVEQKLEELKRKSQEMSFNYAKNR